MKTSAQRARVGWLSRVIASALRQGGGVRVTGLATEANIEVIIL